MLTAEALLSYTQLTKSVMLTSSGIPDPLPPAFHSIKENVLGDKAQYIQLYGNRRLANRVPYGAPPKVTAKQPVSQASLRLMQFSNQMVIDQELMGWLREFASYEPSKLRAMNLIEYQGREFRQLLDNTRTASIGLFLAEGKNWFDSNGYLLNSSTNSVDSIDQGVSTNNTGNIVDTNSPGGYIFNSSWALPETDVVTQLKNLDTLAAQRSGQPLDTALYSRNVPGYLAQNQSARSFWPFQGDKVDALLNGLSVPDGFGGLNWVSVQKMFYETTTGTKVEIFQPDRVTFCPKLTPDTYTLFEGSMFVPGLFSLSGDAVGGLKGMKEVQGMGRYAYWPNPREIVDVAFDTFLPKFRNPDAYFLAKVTN